MTESTTNTIQDETIPGLVGFAKAALGRAAMDETACRAELIGFFYPDLDEPGFQCLRCGHRYTRPSAWQNFLAGKRLTCSKCRLKFDWKEKTPFRNTQWAAGEILLLCAMAHPPATNADLGAILGKSPDTISVWRRKL